MIRISIQCNQNGLLEQLSAKGHAISGYNGDSIICAAVSIITRTAARVLIERNGFEVDLQIPEPGVFFLGIKSFPLEDKQWLMGVSNFIYSGFKDLLKDYPEEIELNI